MRTCTVVFKSTLPTHTTLYMLADRPENGKSPIVEVTADLDRWRKFPTVAKDFRVVAVCNVIHPVFMPGNPDDIIELFRQKFYKKLEGFCNDNAYGEKFVDALAWEQGEEICCDDSQIVL